MDHCQNQQKHTQKNALTKHFDSFIYGAYFDLSNQYKRNTKEKGQCQRIRIDAVAE